MKNRELILILLLLLAVVGCKNETKETKEIDSIQNGNETIADEVIEDTIEAAEINLKLESENAGNGSGEVTFLQEGSSVSMSASFVGLPSGKSVIYLMEDDMAEDQKEFIGTVNADASGNGMISFITDKWCIGCKDSRSDITGKTIIVYQEDENEKGTSPKLVCKATIQ